jgi:hypothetical protein
MDRIVFLKGDIIISKKEFMNNTKKTVICTETTCSKTSKTFKGVDINTGDFSEYSFLDYIKSKTDKLYTQNELKRSIASSEHRLLGKCIDINGNTLDMKRWRENAYREYSNSDREL